MTEILALITVGYVIWIVIRTVLGHKWSTSHEFWKRGG